MALRSFGTDAQILRNMHPSVRVKKNIKNMKQSQMNFKEIRLVLLLFLQLHPLHASHSQVLPSSFVKVKSFAPRQIQRRSFAALAITLSRKIF